MGIFNFIYKNLRQKEEKKIFSEICKFNNLNLEYKDNKNNLDILKEIFIDRCYSSYFPFYQDAIVFDIGAHKGFFSLFAINNLGKNSNIYAFEPFEDNFKDLKKNFSLNNCEKKINAFNIGVFSKKTTLDLYLNNSENNSIFIEHSNLLNINNKSKILKKIEVVTLEDLFEITNVKKIDFMKIDCEGAEYPFILESNTEFIKKINTISLEFHDLKKENFTALKLIKFFEKNGFNINKFEYEKTTINNNFGKIVVTRF